MDTINISLPSQLKGQADELIHQGHFASFSDLVRTALRKIIAESQYDVLIREALKEHAKGKTTVLTSAADIRRYIRSKTT